MIAKIYPKGHPDVVGKELPIRYFDIRKLTERECFRLMGVDDQSCDTLCNTDKICKSARYKLAGNSIVVDCLYYIFSQIWNPKPTQKEPSLFDIPQFKAELSDTINMVTLCSGYDSQALAMKKIAAEIGNDFDLLAWAEFDPESKKPINEQPAVIAHNLLFPQWSDRNVGDMTKVQWDDVKKRWEGKEVDILTYSTPCQSISQSGKREGIAKGSGTRSAVLWYTEQAIRSLRPKFLLQENVRALCNKVNRPHFEEWQRVCNDCGYDNYWNIMNAKDYGVPQNRERVFMLSVRRDLNLPPFEFPRPFKLDKEVADVLEEDVDEKYFLNPKNVIKFLQENEKEKAAGIRYVYTDHKLTEEELNNL